MGACAALVLLACSLALVSADNWAVLICGSHGYGNYRHHADVCHAYDTLVKRGVPADNIITFLYDDVADSLENPFRGQLFNQPSDGPGVDVYAGCKKDYTKELTNKENLINVLEGNAEKMKHKGTGRVLNSTKDDNVFINFVDHGGVGIIAMGAGDLMQADELVDTLKFMWNNKMYKNLVFYMEACESGSMFQALPDDMNIYATTAADASESSWGTYCPPDDKVDNKNMNTCLGDLYSVNWLQDADSSSSFSETLEQQYELVKKETNRSHVTQFGDQSMSSMLINEFIGGKKLARPSVAARAMRATRRQRQASDVDSRMASTHSLYSRFASAEGERRVRLGRELLADVQSQLNFDTMFESISASFFADRSLATSETTVTQWQCYRAANDAIQAACGGYTDYSLKYSRVVANMCEHSNGNAQSVVATIEKHCAQF